MVQKRKLKEFVLPTIFIFIIMVVFMIGMIFSNNMSKPVFNDDTDFIYTTRSIFENALPTVLSEATIVKPYTDESVKINKYFYDYLGEKENQENSIILYDETYMQNSGINYICESNFNVVSILDGKVIKVGEDTLLGKFIEIKHDNDITSVYQGLSEVNVVKDSSVKQGDMIGKSGKNNIEPKEENTLHFEMIISGSFVNPLEYFDKKVQDL